MSAERAAAKQQFEVQKKAQLKEMRKQRGAILGGFWNGLGDGLSSDAAGIRMQKEQGVKQIDEAITQLNGLTFAKAERQQKKD